MSPRTFGLRAWHAAFFAAALLVCVVILAPVSLVLRPQEGGFTFERAEGTIWRARFFGVRLGSINAGDVDWRLDPASLGHGAIGGRLTLAGGQLKGDVVFLYGPDGMRWLQSDRLVLKDVKVADLPAKVAVFASGLDIAFSNGRCASAAGQLQGDVAGDGGLSLSGASLTGTAICGGDEVWLPLEGASGGGRVRFVITLRQNGDAQWQADIVPASVEIENALTIAGFAVAPGESYLRKTRTFRWLPI
jgi:hypothetical protein